MQSLSSQLQYITCSTMLFEAIRWIGFVHDKQERKREETRVIVGSYDSPLKYDSPVNPL